MKLISNSMHWAWKLSFAICAFIFAYVWALASQNWGYANDEVLLGLMPISLWLTIRWLTVKE